MHVVLHCQSKLAVLRDFFGSLFLLFALAPTANVECKLENEKNEMNWEPNDEENEKDMACSGPFVFEVRVKFGLIEVFWVHFDWKGLRKVKIGNINTEWAKTRIRLDVFFFLSVFE